MEEYIKQIMQEYYNASCRKEVFIFKIIVDLISAINCEKAKEQPDLNLIQNTQEFLICIHKEFKFINMPATKSALDLLGTNFCKKYNLV